MDDVWLCVDEDSNSSHNSVYSDDIDSEIEAELYGMIHHQENLSDAKNPHEGNSTNSGTSITFDSTRDDINDRSCVEVENVTSDSTRSFGSPSNSLNINNSKEALCNIDRNNSEINASKLSRPLKRKTDSLSVVLCPEDSEAKASSQMSSHNVNKKENRKISYNSSRKISFSKRNDVTIASSSDSDDSVIWTEPDNSFKSDIKMNLYNGMDTISINFNSSEDSIIASTPLRRPVNPKNISLPNIKFGERSNDIWHINDDDLYRSKKRSRRYHETTDGTKCSNCDKQGHSARTCSVPKIIKCFYCGGEHVGSRCKNRICSKCYTTGHDRKFCWLHNSADCYHCNMRGHFAKDCPDIWRRYHLTTEPTKIVPGKPVYQDQSIYCFNCGRPGHIGAECHEPRNAKGSFITWPSVISYSSPDDLLAKRLGKRRNVNNNFRMIVPESQGQQNLIPGNTNLNQNQQFRSREDSVTDRSNYQENQHFNSVKEFIAERTGENQNKQMKFFQAVIAERNGAKKEFKKSNKWELHKQRQIEQKSQNKAAFRESEFLKLPEDSMADRCNYHQVQNSNTVKESIFERTSENQDHQMEMFHDIIAERNDVVKEFKKSNRWQFYKQRQIERKRQKKAALRGRDFPRSPDDSVADNSNYHQNQHLSTVKEFIAKRTSENQNQQREFFQTITAERNGAKKEFQKLNKSVFVPGIRQTERNRQKQAALREKDFPRTPKSLKLDEVLEPLCESVTLTLKHQQQRKKKNQKRKWKRFKQKLQGENN